MSSSLPAPGATTKKSMITRDLRTADSATKVLERATVATTVAQRAMGMGQRMALLGQLSSCMAALAAEEATARSEIIKAKEYALWMGGIAEEEEDLYRDDTVLEDPNTHNQQSHVHRDNVDDVDDDYIGSDHSPTPREESGGGVSPRHNRQILSPPPPPAPPKSTFALSIGAKKTLKDPSFKSKVQRTQEHQAYSQAALRGRSSCLFWPVSHPFNLDTQERNPTTAITSPAAFTRSLRCGRPDSALTSLRYGKLGKVGDSTTDQPPPASRAVTYRRFFPTDDPQDCNMDPSRAFPSPTATIAELREKCVCLRASVPTKRDHKYHASSSPEGLLMMKAAPTSAPNQHQTSPPLPIQLSSQLPSPNTTSLLQPTTMGAFTSNLQECSASLTSLPHTPATGVTPTSRASKGLPNCQQHQHSAPVVTSSAVLELGVETDLRPRWDGSGSTLPPHLVVPKASAAVATSPKASKVVIPATTPHGTSSAGGPMSIPALVSKIPTVASRDETSLVSREVGDYIHYLADAMDHASSVSAAHRVEGSSSSSSQQPAAIVVEPPLCPLTDDDDDDAHMDNITAVDRSTLSAANKHRTATDDDNEDTSTAASIIEAAVSEAQRHNKATFDYHLDEDGKPSTDPATKLTPAGGAESWVDASQRRDHIRAQARAFRVAVNKVMTDENEQRWELVHSQIAGDKRLYRMFRVDHAKSQRDLLSSQRIQRRDLERLLTLELLKLVVVWEHQHEELHALFKSQHTILKSIAVGRGVLGVEEGDARACLDRYEGVARRHIYRTHMEVLSSGLADTQRRHVEALRQAQREQDELSIKELLRDEEEELERQSREDERAQRAAEDKAAELRSQREAYLQAL